MRGTRDRPAVTAAELGGQRVRDACGDGGLPGGQGVVPGSDQAGQGAAGLPGPDLAGVGLGGVGEVAYQAPREVPDGLTQCLGYEQTGGLYQHWLAPTGTTTLGPLGSFPEFWINADREPDYAWWLPSKSELERRAAEVRAEQQRERASRLSRAIVY